MKSWWYWNVNRRLSPDRRGLWIANHMPRWLVMWCAIRLIAHATSGEYGNSEPDKTSVMTALKRWDTAR